MKNKIQLTVTFLLAAFLTFSQDSVENKKLSLHLQTTVISQGVNSFKSLYFGNNSFLPTEPIRTSFTTTFFAAYKPFKNTYFVFNPEVSAGKGLSKTTGIAGFPNGEVYRVGNPNPQIFVARLYAEQRFPLNNKKEIIEDDLNQIQEKINSEYFSVLAGKFSLTDFFDNSEISHDPRTQFMNWSLMGSGAFDYPANVRGYTFGVLLQFKKNNWALRLAETAVPLTANGSELQWKGSDAGSTVLELELNNLFKKNNNQFSTLHIGGFINKARMGNYKMSIDNAIANSTYPDITDSREYGRTKAGFYLSIDNHFGKVHHFIKGSWNDGQNETWAFTEIDRSFATGFLFDGAIWKRKKDNFGIAFVVNRISKEHKEYLAMGGYGFIIGDGYLNYGAEKTFELFYSFNVWKKIFISPDFQYTINPGYNKDRGPASIYGIRFHAEL